jgi:hypothetical protein
MQMVPVDSSNIHSVGFDPEQKVMRIQFIGGGLYEYSGPTAEKAFNDLLAAESKGKHFTKHIRHDPELKVTRIS